MGKWHLGWDWSFKKEYENIDGLNQILEVDYTQPVRNGPNDRGFTYSYGISSSLDIPPYVYLENGRVTALPDRKTINVDEKGFWRDGPTGSDFDHTMTLSHLTEKAVTYIDRQAGLADPFFLYFALPAPHTPILPLTEFMGKSNSNMYGDFMLQVDDVVGQIIGALEAKGELDNTLIIYTSDNGCSLGLIIRNWHGLGMTPAMAGEAIRRIFTKEDIGYRFWCTGRSELQAEAHQISLFVRLI